MWERKNKWGIAAVGLLLLVWGPMASAATRLVVVTDESWTYNGDPVVPFEEECEGWWVDIEEARWIWKAIEEGEEKCSYCPGVFEFFTRSFEIPSNAIILWAELSIAADDIAWVYINDDYVGEVYVDYQEISVTFDVANYLRGGSNTVKVSVQNLPEVDFPRAQGEGFSEEPEEEKPCEGRNPAGCIARLEVEYTLPPVAQDDEYYTVRELAVDAPGVLGNDSDPDGDPIYAELVSADPEEHASYLQLNPDGSFTYEPPQLFMGTVTFIYRAYDVYGASSNPAKLVIRVRTVHPSPRPPIPPIQIPVVPKHPPVAVDDAYEVWEDGTLEAGVLHNDSYPSELPCFLKIVKGTKFGDLQFNSYTGNFVYTPLPNFYGKDIFEYELCCDGACDTAEVTLEVLPRNDPVRGEDVDVRTCTGKAVGFALIAYDADIPAEDFQDHPLRFEVIHGPGYGTLTADWTNVAYQAGRAVLHAVYAPDPGFVGEDALVVRVSDIFGDTDYLRVRVKVDDCRRGEVALGPVVIHEIAWAGTPASPEDQWIELRNLTDESVALTGWTLRWRKKEPKTEEDMIWREIRLSGVIQARGFFLLERGHDEVVRDIPADLIYPATIRVGEWEIPLLFSPEGDAVMLVNAAGAVVDTANADPRRPRGWAAGDFATKASMERKAPYLPDRDENWWTNLGLVTHGLDRKGQEIRGTANALNEPELLACQEPPLEVASGEKVTLIRALRVVPKAFPRAVLVRMEGDLPVAALPAGDRLAVHLDATLGLVNVVLDTTGLQPGVYHLVLLLAQNRPLMARLQIR